MMVVIAVVLRIAANLGGEMIAKMIEKRTLQIPFRYLDLWMKYPLKNSLLFWKLNLH